MIGSDRHFLTGLSAAGNLQLGKGIWTDPLVSDSPSSFIRCGSLDLDSGEGSMVQEGGKSPHPRSHWGLVSCSLGLGGV